MTGCTTDLLTVQGFSKAFGSYQVLNDVSFTVKTGEILGLIGPNGAGKSTLLECIAGLLSVDKGEVICHETVLPMDRRKQFIWYQPDNISPFARQKVSTTLSFFQRVQGLSKETLTDLLERLDLFTVLDKPFLSLSKGFRRRTLLAIALLSAQSILMLDEPFDGFDLRQTLSVMALLASFRQDRAMILSIHQLSEAEKICDRFLLLDEGRALGLGTLDDLRRQTKLSTDASLEEVFLAIT